MYFIDLLQINGCVLFNNKLRRPGEYRNSKFTVWHVFYLLIIDFLKIYIYKLLIEVRNKL